MPTSERDLLRMAWGFFLGPDKSGSSWLHALARGHPRVAAPVAKELFFFDRYFERGLSWYLGQFAVTRETATLVEVCHDYLFSPSAARRIHHVLPHARLVICLRHPLDRAISAYHYMRRQGRIRIDFSEALRCEYELLDHGRYAHHLTPYWERFPDAQFTYLDFGVLRSDPASVGVRFLRGIGAPPPYEFDAANLAPARPAAAARNQALATLGKRVADGLRERRLEAVVGRLKQSRLAERALFRPLRPDERQEPTAVDREYAAERLEGDALALDRRLGTDYARRWWGSGQDDVTVSRESPPG